MKTFLLFIFLSAISFLSSAQDTIVLLTGRKIIVSSVDLKDYSIAYRPLKPNSKLRTIDPLRVFSIAYHDGNERVVYQSDSLDPLDFKPEEMRQFVYGAQDARAFYKNNFIKGAGVIVGGAGALLAFYGIVVPPLYATTIGSFSPNVEKKLSFDVSGDGAEDLGIADNVYMNTVTGAVSGRLMKKGHRLHIGHSIISFNEDAPVDSVVNAVNEKFSSHRVHAKNDNGKLGLYRSTRGNLISQDTYREGFEKRVRDYKIRKGMISALIGFVAASISYVVFLK